MNKIFKVVWSASKQCYVVASELATNTSGKKENYGGYSVSCISNGRFLTSWG